MPRPGRADLDPENDRVVAPPDLIEDCERRLDEAGVVREAATIPVRASGGFSCGAPQVVLYRRATEGVRYQPSPIVTCGMALALARFEKILQEEAVRTLGEPIVRIEQGGTYSCRKMARFADFVSEHSYANAIDIYRFVLQSGRAVSVQRHFGKPPVEPTAPEGLFLRSAARRLFDEEVFSVVLTPFFDRLHHDHFHVDLARYRVDGTR